MESVEGQTIGPYVLLAPLAHGGMGSVYFAARKDQRQPRTLLSIKTLKSNLVGVDDYAGRFNDEAKVALRLRHKNLLEVSDAGVDGENFYLAMELIEGITFRRLLSLLEQQKRKLRSTEAAALTTALLRGLHAAHTATDEAGRPLGVVHRDVSPHNTMVDVTGRVKVIDYGLATSVLKETFTESMVALGKSAYMPPEQARGEDVTAAGDQYAAGIVFYELLTGDRFYGDYNARSIWGVVGSGLHKPRSWDKVPERFREVLQKALAPKPEDRHASCDAFADAIVAIEPRAARSEAVHGLKILVTDLAPAELALIHDARAALVRFDEQTEKNPAAVVRNVEPTQVVRRSRSAEETADTASTLIRARQLVPVRKTRAPLLAAAGVALSAAATVAVLLVPGVAANARAALGIPAPVAVVAPIAPVAPVVVAAPVAAPVVAAPVVAAPVVAPGASVGTAGASADSAAAAAGQAEAQAAEAKKRLDGKRARLVTRAKRFLAASGSCADGSVVLLVKNALQKLEQTPTVDLALFERTLQSAEETCPQR